MRGRRALAVATALTLLAGCGGGSSTPSVVPQQPVPQASQPAQKAPQSASVRFTIVIPTPAPATARRPAYVSPATKSASIAVGSASATMVNCTTTCSATVSAPIGSDTFTVKLFDATNGSGNLLSTGSLTQTIVAGQANTVNVTFNGVVASLQMSAFPTVTPGTAGSVAVGVNALDADGNAIIGPGNYVDANGNPVTIALANSDTSGNSSFSQSTLTAPPASPVTLNYTASFDANPTITASATGFTSVHAQVVFPAPTFTAMSVWSGLANSTVSETLTGTNFVAGSTSVTPPAGITVSNVSVTSSTTLTANFAVGAVGFATYQVALGTSNGSGGQQPFAVGTGAMYVVNNFADANASSPPGTGLGVSTGTTSGDLRWVLQNAPAGSRVSFPSSCTPSAPCVIALNGPLPQINKNIIVDGGTYGSVIINGQNQYRAFWAESGIIVLANLLIQNAAAIGGASNNAAGGGGGGGGAGLGGGLFVDSSGAVVSLINDYFLSDAAIGGNGGSSAGSGILGGSGGGGLAGNGGYGIGGGGGGGGLLGPGSVTANSSGANGGVGYASCTAGGGGPAGVNGVIAGAGGAGQAGVAQGCAGGGGGAGAANSLGSGGAGGNAGSGGFGAGGGGGGSGGPTSSTGNGGNGGQGGNGGFGGGGAGGGGGGNGGPGNGNGGNGGSGGTGNVGGGGGGGGTGGAGGGLGAAGAHGSDAHGGSLSSGIAGGNAANGSGGGGAAVGPAVFVNAGVLITFNSDAGTCSATPGSGGSPGGGNGGADATPVFNYGGTVNGATVTTPGVNGGPVASALGTSVP